MQQKNHRSVSLLLFWKYFLIICLPLWPLPTFFKNKKRLENKKTLKHKKRDQNKKNVFFIYGVKWRFRSFKGEGAMLGFSGLFECIIILRSATTVSKFLNYTRRTAEKRFPSAIYRCSSSAGTKKPAIWHSRLSKSLQDQQNDVIHRCRYKNSTRRRRSGARHLMLTPFKRNGF